MTPRARGTVQCAPFGVAFALLALAASAGGADAQRLAYPPTPRDSVVDDYHGVRVADPYRWLERLGDPATIGWVNAQRRLTDDYLARLPEREPIRRRLESLWNFSRTEVPWREAGRLWFVENSGLERQPVLYTQKSLIDTPTVALNPQVLSPDGSLAVSEYAVSPDGRWLSYNASHGGADVGEMRVRDLATGRDLPDAVRGAWGGACWTFDGQGFFYMRPPPPRPGAPPDAPRVEKQLLYHVLGEPPSRDRMLREWKDNFRWLYRIWRHHSEALASMRVPETVLDPASYSLHPGLIDSCFQLIGVSGVATDAHRRALELVGSGRFPFESLPRGTAGFDDVDELLATMAGETDRTPPLHAVFVPR